MRDPLPADGWSARGYVGTGITCVALLAIGLGGWGSTARLEGAVVAAGQLRVETRHQVVQHPDGGIVAQIFVEEGDPVARGEVLIRLDGSELRSEMAAVESELHEVMARRGRLDAEASAGGKIAFAPELLTAGRADPAVRSIIEGQEHLFEARRDTMIREIAVMHARQVQIRDQIAGTRSGIAAVARQRALIGEELNIQRGLLEKGLAEASRVLALEREAARLDGERAAAIAEIARLEGQISQIDVEILHRGDSRREQAIGEMRDLGVRELELRQKRSQLGERLSRLDIRAPMEGIVLDMSVHTLGAVIRPAEPILQIVPQDAALVVDAAIDPLHIASVAVGQKAGLRLAALGVSATPVLNGVVSGISADALAGRETERPYYRVEVAIAPGEITRLKGQRLIAGMPVEVFIRTAARTPLEYLLKPLSEYVARAMREE